MAHARGVLRDNHTERVAQVRAGRQGAADGRGRQERRRRFAGRPRDRGAGRERRVRHQERSPGGHTLEVLVEKLKTGRRLR